MYFISNIQNNKIANFKTKEKKKNNRVAITSGIGAAYLGQKTIRSGIPRLLGVRLESHSTSKKTAKEILKNGGILDPNKSGSGAIRALESNAAGVGTDINKAKNKVYITGIHKNAIAREMPSPMGFGTVTVDAKKENPLQQVINRADQRRGYRGQSTIDWDFVNKDSKRFQELDKQTFQTPFGKSLPNQQLADEYTNILKGNQERLAGERSKAVLKGQLPTTGRSLYIGGSDEFFNKNFKPDFDDPRAMYSEEKVKVYGNRLKATAAAIKKEGLLKLMKGNPKRVLAGAAITGLGGLGTGILAKRAIDNSIGEIKVKDFFRRGKKVKGYSRKKKKR